MLTGCGGGSSAGPATAPAARAPTTPTDTTTTTTTTTTGGTTSGGTETGAGGGTTSGGTQAGAGTGSGGGTSGGDTGTGSGGSVGGSVGGDTGGSSGAQAHIYQIIRTDMVAVTTSTSIYFRPNGSAPVTTVVTADAYATWKTALDTDSFFDFAYTESVTSTTSTINETYFVQSGFYAQGESQTHYFDATALNIVIPRNWCRYGATNLHIKFWNAGSTLYLTDIPSLSDNDTGVSCLTILAWGYDISITGDDPTAVGEYYNLPIWMFPVIH
ncbi:MAG: hypothetical protein H7318_14280 [Oligoflexus sp.]|nr:hypothetical protein [Oligoflexus sp.]